MLILINATDPSANVEGKTVAQSELTKLRWSCRACGHMEDYEEGGLLYEINLQQNVSEGYKVLLNEFTRLDPTLPHVSNIKCPNDECGSNTGAADRDVIYMKYDAVNLKYLYICNVCEQHWKSRA
jgi:hypothetical protein